MSGLRIIDLNLAAQALLERRHGGMRCRELAAAAVPPDMVEFLEAGAFGMAMARDAVAAVEAGELVATDEGVQLVWREEDVELAAPLLPRSLRELSAYEGHLRAVGMEPPPVWYDLPLYWKGNPHAVIGPDVDVVWPKYTSAMDFELEIAAVIGRVTRDASPMEAAGAIAGFTIFNDVSARDVQRRENEFLLGPSKGKDFCNVLGPVLVTSDEIDPDNLAVAVSVNGEVWARGDTSGMQHRWGDVVSYLSQDETLYPGDVITSGTVTGCSALEHYPGRDLAAGLIQSGDVVELEVESIGILRNRYLQSV
ncbi:MAG: fumarylacetoacetate hydrolase family protein [Actinomycetota bacterium]|nr:fumarylacetoacetate hydrolase family protein [Actinomycetota bacterium]